MRDLHVIVSNKIATYLNRDGSIVCGNSDYQIVFTFDSEWDAHNEKVARFIWNNGYRDVAFTGDTVTVPVLNNTKQLKVGVYAGELCTTTPAVIDCQLSILCGTTNGMPLTPSQYEEVMERIDELEQNGSGGSGGTTSTLTSVSVTEAADGTVTMVNKLESGSETIVIKPDEGGNPASVTYNGTAIPVEWTVETA